MRYDKTSLEVAVKDSISFSEVLKKLGRKPVGSLITNVKITCQRHGIDTSHLLGQAHTRGKILTERQTTPDEILVEGTSLNRRTETHKLRRSLIAIGVPHVCNVCGIDEWLGSPLILEIDHIDGQYWNNKRDNLQFLCPNCHAMKERIKMPS